MWMLASEQLPLQQVSGQGVNISYRQVSYKDECFYSAGKQEMRLKKC